MQLRRFTILAALALASAAPGRRRDYCAAKAPSPSLPINGGDHELDAPPAGTRLLHVVLGHGYQNYTCTSDPTTGTYVSSAAGALAVLYDIKPLFPSQSPSSLPLPSSVFSLAHEAAHTAAVPLNLLDPSSSSSSATNRTPGSAPPVAVSDPWLPPADLSLPGAGGADHPVRFAGRHYFDAGGVPVFEMAGGADLFRGKKTGDASAPAGAAEGPDGGRAVAWLAMGDAGGSVRVRHVYRVNTVGGSGHVCDGEGEDSAVYTAFYYMFG